LKKQIEDNYKGEHKFICLTDFEDMTCDTIKLKHDLPGWWSKIELFQPELVSDNPKDVFIFFDLDTCIVGDITELVEYPHDITGLAEVNAAGLVPGRFGSGIAAWRGDKSKIYTEFMKDKVGNMAKYKVGGDQHVIHDSVLVDGKVVFKPVQKIIDGCLNYKHDLPAMTSHNVKAKENLPDNAKIVYFHGLPKPWDSHVHHQWLDKELYNINNY
ncbi:MAG: hypothetical protein KAS32_18460, partial [Candidatus Peribacteraceae bacterium]|nr:hypothetical protein [Candidatus Peribacteraceae bacterium]